MMTDVLGMRDLEDSQLLVIAGGNLQLLLEGFTNMPGHLSGHLRQEIMHEKVAIYTWSAGTTAMGTTVNHSPDNQRKITLKTATFKIKDRGIALFPFGIKVHANTINDKLDVDDPILYLPDNVVIYVTGKISDATYSASCETAKVAKVYYVLNRRNLAWCDEDAIKGHDGEDEYSDVAECCHM